MDLKIFTKQIKSTALLTEEDKTYFLSKAAKYPPELRTELIKELEKHEKKFIHQGKQKIAQIKGEEHEETHKQMKEIESVHRREEEHDKAQADVDLAEDLLNM